MLSDAYSYIHVATVYFKEIVITNLPYAQTNMINGQFQKNGRFAQTSRVT